MANLQLIKDIAEKRNISIKNLAERVGISEQQVHLIVRTNSTKVGTLEKIAEALGVRVGVFFEESVTIDNRTAGHDYSEHGGVHYHLGAQSSAASDEGSGSADSAVLTERVKALEAMLAEKERTIQILLNR